MVFAKSLIGLVFLTLVATSAIAGERQLKEQVNGRTEAPVGFVEFCNQQPAECTKSKSSLGFMPSDAMWLRLRWINNMVNTSVSPNSDEELYGEKDHWAYANKQGDCEDYALLKMKHLLKWGFPKSSLRLTVVFDENNEGHAVLSLVTKTTDYVLDNRRSEVLVWDETGYIFLKREPAGGDPMNWENIMPLNFVTAAN